MLQKDVKITVEREEEEEEEWKRVKKRGGKGRNEQRHNVMEVITRF